MYAIIYDHFYLSLLRYIFSTGMKMNIISAYTIAYKSVLQVAITTIAFHKVFLAGLRPFHNI